MPLSRYLVRNEYGLADPELYKAAEKDDPEALLEGVAMAGLVGVLRQLGDLAEFAAEMFHDLHEEVMSTAARGHALIARVQQLEAELPSAENILLSQTTHIPFLYNTGIDWHPNIRMDENLVTQGDMPRFVMDSYEECRGPPRLFLLDKFDVAGAGACLKRYTDPSFCKVESADFNIKNPEGQREKRTRKVKRRGSTWRNGDTPDVFPSSHAKLHQLLLEERIETGANDPERRVKLKKRPLDGFTREDRLKSYMQKFVNTYSSDTKAVREISLDLVPVNVPLYNDNCHSGLEIVTYDTFSPSPEPFYKDKVAYSSYNIPEVVKPSLSEFNEVTDSRVEEISASNNGADIDNLSDMSEEDLAKSGGSVGEYNDVDIASEVDNYVDALATLESETETDSDTRTRSHRWTLNGMKRMIDSDGNEDKRQQNLFLDHHSRGDSSISDDCSLPKKETDIFSSSDNVSNSAEYSTAKSSAVDPVNSLAGENSATREAQVNNTKEEPLASDVAEYMGIVNSEFKELPWISVNAGSALTETDTVIEQTDQESTEQAVVKPVPETDTMIDDYDHSMPVGIYPLDVMADASSVSSSDNSSHSQPEFCRNGQSTSLSETKNSSVSSPTNSINDLKQPVEATSDALTSSISVPDFPEAVYARSEENNMSQINETSSDDQSKHDDLESVGEMVSLATDTDRTVEPRVLTPADSEDSCVHSAEPLSFGYIESTEQLEFNSSESSYSHSGDESGDWIIHEPTVDKTNMISDDSRNAGIAVNPSQVCQSNQVRDVPDASQHFDSLTIAEMEDLSKSDNADKSVDDCIASYQNQSSPAPVGIGDVHLVYDTSEPVQAEGDTISSVDISHDKDAKAAISSQTITAEYPSEHVPEVKDDLGFADSVETKESSSSYDCLEVENTKTERQMISSIGYEVELQNPVSCERDEYVTSKLTASDTSSAVLISAVNVGEFSLEDGQTSVCPTSREEASLSSVECNHNVIETQLTSDKMIELQGVEITSQPLEYAEPFLHPEDGKIEKCSNPISVSSLCPQSLTADESIQSDDHKVKSQLLEGESSPPSFSESAADLSNHLLPAEAQGSLKFENPGQNVNLTQVTPPLFGTSPNSIRVAPGDMPPLPPLPPIQWRLGRNQHTSLAFGGLMQNPFGIPQSSQEPGTSDNAGLRYQHSSMHQHPFLSSSGEEANLQHAAQYPDGYLQEPTDSPHSRNMSHEDGQQHAITLEHRRDTQPFTVSQHNQLNNLSSEPSESRLMTDDAITPALFEEVIQKETNVAHDQVEDNLFPVEQEAAGVDEKLEYNTEIATTSAQFGPLMPTQYGNQLSHGFSDPEAQGIWSDVFSARIPENGNGSLQKKIQRPRNPLIDAVVAVDKSKLRKVGEIVKQQDKPEYTTREQHLPQLRKVGNRMKPQDKPETTTREQHLPQLRKVANRVKPKDKPEGETREQHLPQLRKVGQRVKPQDAVKAEGSSQNFTQLRKAVHRVKPQDLPSAERSSQQLPQLRNVDKKTKSQDEPKARDEPQSLLPLRSVGEKPKPQDESQAENKDWLEQIRNQSFNLKRAATSRPNIQGRQTNLKVAAILEKASMIRQAMAGNDDDSDGWSDS